MLSSPFNDEPLQGGTVWKGLVEGKSGSVERDPDGVQRGSTFFQFICVGASCHSFSLKVVHVFDQTVTQIGPLIMCTYLEYTAKEVSSFNFDSDRICSLG